MDRGTKVSSICRTDVGQHGQSLATARKLFGQGGAFYLTLIDTLAPILLQHEYIFFSDEEFSTWMKSEGFSVQRLNYIVAREIVEKAHLAAVLALFRAKRWANAICLMHDNANFIGWAASFRGLLESAGDTLDGLLNIPLALATHNQVIIRCLAEQAKTFVVEFSDLEGRLDHFVHAGWMRIKKGQENKLKAKDSNIYVGLLENVIPGVLAFYHRLCAIAHPSSASIDYFYATTPGREGGLKLTATNDTIAIASICQEFPKVLAVTLQMNCNPAFLILRVLHRFRVHPQLPGFNRQIDWSAIEAWAEIERRLRN